MLLDIAAHGLHHAGIGGDQIIAAHAGFSWNTGGYDHDVGILERLAVIVGPVDLGIEAFDRRGFDQIQRFAGGHVVDDVEQDDVTQLFLTSEEGEGTADLAGTD